MKLYVKRLMENAKKREVIYWWVLRILMLGALVDSIFFRKDVQQSLQTGANFVLMFLWEAFMLFPEKRWPRHVPSYIQNYLIFALFLGSFGGAYLNFYYSIPAYDIIMHTVGGVFCTTAGYEIIVAMQKRDKLKVSVPIAVLGAFGFSFFAGTGWELFEFIFDQVAPNIGDAQHWSLALAQEAADAHDIGLPNIIPARDPMRYALMDTMEDTVCNTVGGILGWIILKLYPYHHKGKHNVNNLFENGAPKKEEKVLLTK